MRKLILLFLCMGCSENVFNETAKKNTPAAVYYQAKRAMNEGNYNSAIQLLDSLGAAFLAQRDVGLVYASAYSGRCGLNFVDLLMQLENISSAPSLFAFFMQTYPDGTDARINDCFTSETTLNSFGNYSVRTADENILMGLSSLTKVGVVLSRYADTDGDGVTDPGFDHCSTTDLPDDAVREIGTGIANAILSISAVSSSISSDTLTDITTVCGYTPQLNSFCNNTDKSAYSANEVLALRSILGSTDEGIGAATCAGSFITCPCL